MTWKGRAVNVHDAITATRLRLLRYATGDEDAVLGDEADRLRGHLMSYLDESPEAGIVAGELAWARYWAARTLFDLSDLTDAVALLCGEDAEPAILTTIRTTRVSDSYEAGNDEAILPPAQVLTAVDRMYGELTGDGSAHDVHRLRFLLDMAWLGVKTTAPGGELRRRGLALSAALMLAWVGATASGSIVARLARTCRESLAAAQAGPHETHELLYNLGIALVVQYTVTGDPSVLEEAVEVLRHGTIKESTIASGGSQHLDNLVHAELVLGLDVARAEGVHDYRQVALRAARLSLREQLGPNLPDVEVRHGMGPTTITRRDGSPVAITHDLVPGGTTSEYRLDGRAEPERTASINIAESTIAAINDDLRKVPWWNHRRRTALLAELSQVYRERFLQRRRPEYLEQAIELAVLVVHGSRLWSRRRLRAALRVLTAAQLDRYHLHRRSADLDEVIRGLERMVKIGAPSAEQQADDLSLLASLYLTRVPGRHRRTDLRAALSASRRAVHAAPQGSPAALAAMGVRGLCLLYAADRGGLDADHDTAMELLRKATELPPDHVNHSVACATLANVLIERYRRGGARAELDQAIDLLRTARDSQHANQWTRAYELRESLADALALRAAVDGARSDLDDAITLLRESAETLPGGHPARSDTMISLARLLACRGGADGPADLAEAIRIAEHLVTTAEGSAARTRARVALAQILGTPTAPTGSPEPEGSGELGRQKRLSRAIELRRSSDVTAADPDNSAALARALHDLFLVRAGRGELTIEVSLEAEMLYRQILDGDPDDRAVQLGLASVLFERSSIRSEPDAAAQAAELARSAAVDASLAAAQRIAAARLWAAAAAQCGNWPVAVRAFGVAVGLLPELAPPTLTRDDQLYQLAVIANLPSDAAVCAVRAGDAAAGVRMFEAARGILWAQLGQAGRSLHRLRARRPDLADRFVELRKEIGGDSGWVDPQFPYAWRRTLAGDPGDPADRRQAIGDKWREVIAEIRALDGFATFPAPVEDQRLHPGVDGPVVLLAASRYGSFAIIVHPDERIETVELAGLTPQVVSAAAADLRSAVNALGRPRLPRWRRLAGELAITSVLQQADDLIVGPVLARCPAPRIWWIPAGDLAGIPLHAGAQARARTVSSYSTTVAALRTPPGTGTGRRVLAVTMATTPGASALPHVRLELEALRRFAPTVLAEPDATKESTTRAISRSEVLHLACHTARSTVRSVARVLLHDHQTEPFTLVDIARLTVPDAQLAFLSSCATSVGDERVPDEGSHLAAAFHSAGFPQVIATLWPVRDADAHHVATRFYERVRTPDGAVDTRAAAHALHRIVAELALAEPATPSRWAGHVHVGR